MGDPPKQGHLNSKLFDNTHNLSSNFLWSPCAEILVCVHFFWNSLRIKEVFVPKIM